MKKYIIKNCPNLTTSFYSTGEIVHNQCGCSDDDMCKDRNNCILKKIADKLNTFWCDSVGKEYDEEERQAYINQKIADIFNLLEIEECEDE